MQWSYSVLKHCIAVEKPHSTQGCISEQEVLWQQVGGDDNDTHDDDHDVGDDL